MNDIHLFFGFFICLSSVLVITSTNPVGALFFLIITFCNAGGILIVSGVEFVGLSFVIIYVGAIAVLFLFVIMMIFNKHQLNTSTFNTVLLNRLINFFLGQFVFFLFIDNFSEQNLVFFNKIEFNSDTLKNMDILGQILFNYLLIIVLMAGLLLLIGLLGCILLTYNFASSYEQKCIKSKLSKWNGLSVFFKKNNKRN